MSISIAPEEEVVGSITINYHETATSSIIDLTGTKWLLNETIEYDGNFPTYNINFNAYCESGAVVPLSGLYMDVVSVSEGQSLRTGIEPPTPNPNLYCLRYVDSETIEFSNFYIGQVLYTGTDPTSMTNSANDSTFNGELFNSTIEITGGTDATNSNLISWLQSNATQITETTNAFSFGNLPIENMYFGAQQVQKIYFGNSLVWKSTAEPTPTDMPSKRDIITLDGGTARYRVLGVSGSEALLLAMDDYTSSVYNSPSVTKTFDGGKTGQKYEGSTLDNLLNTTYYNSLSSNVRNAIIDQARIQRMYSFKYPDDPSYDYHQQYNFDATQIRGLPIEDQTTVGSRHVFALDVKDIFDYLEKDTMTSAELNEMFFEQTTSVSKNVWLSSAGIGNSYYAFYVVGNLGCVDFNLYNTSYVVRPAFKVDLTNLAWAKEISVPEKGDIITLDGGSARYRVLKTNGSVAEVLALDDVTNSAFNSSSVTTTFSDDSTGQKYENSTLDNYMNSTFYNSLSANIKAAIIQKAITQSIYLLSASKISVYDFAMTGITFGTYYYKRKGQVNVGNRYCYALDLDDVAEYLGAGSGNTVSGADLNEMFFEQTTAISKHVWLDSALSNLSDSAPGVYGSSGTVLNARYSYSSGVVRPAFQVDLSKVLWVKE